MGKLLAPLLPAEPAERVVDDADLPAYRRLRRDARFEPLLEMHALAGMLSQLALEDIEALAREHGAESLGSIVYALHQEGKRFEIGHAVGFAERVRDFVRGAITRTKHARARSARAARTETYSDRFAAVPCGLPAPVGRSRPTLLVGRPEDVRRLIDHAVAAALAPASPPAVFHLSAGPPGEAPGLPPAAWAGRLYEVKAMAPAGTDLLVVDDVLHGVPQKRGRLSRSRFRRGALGLKQLDAHARIRRAAVLVGYPWDPAADRDDAEYRAMKAWADPYRVERDGAALVVYDRAGEPVLTVPARRPAK